MANKKNVNLLVGSPSKLTISFKSQYGRAAKLQPQELIDRRFYRTIFFNFILFKKHLLNDKNVLD